MEDQNNESSKNNIPPPKGEQPPAGNGPPTEPEGEKPEGEVQAPMLAMTMEEYEALQRDLGGARAKAAEYFDGWQRERADFLNYKKRIDRDNAQVYPNALVTVLKKYLVILDDLDRALKTRPTKGDGAHWAKGIELIERKLLNLIECEGVKRMEADKEMFDPNRHEAISQEDSADHQSGQIIEVIQPGYLLGDRVIRPALVRVAR
jgi:molecular chaperone GrpE